MVTDTKPRNSSDVQRYDRVRQHTSASVNAQIDENMKAKVEHFARLSDADIDQRLLELELEWDTERVLEMNASLLAFIGLMLGLTISSNWFWLPGIVLPFLFQHALQGWCPPLPIIRRLGVRTLHEINQEKYALKALRGDFNDIISTSVPEQETRAESVLQAVKA